MAESIVSGSAPLKKFALIAARAALVWKNIRSAVYVEEELLNLENELHASQAFLRDVDKRHLKEVWLKNLKDVSYEMDDVLDEWKTAMIKSEIEREEEKSENTLIIEKKVRSFIPLSCCCSRQVKKLVLRIHIAHKIKELIGKLDELFKMKDFGLKDFGLNRGTKEVERLITTSLVDVSDIIGRDKAKKELVRELLGEGSEVERNPYVISLVGMGGIGKTALAQLAYNDDLVEDHFDIRMWVCVSDPFDERRVANAIFQEVEGTSPDIIKFRILLHRIQNIIEGKKFFLVLDDVWTEDPVDWKPFEYALKFGAQGSKILVTTRNEEVARMVASVSMIKLEALTSDDCWTIISRIAFFEMDGNQCEQLEDIGKEIANRCKGLPLAAKTLGIFMCDKRSRLEWKNIIENNLWELENVQKFLLEPLLLSYYELSPAIRLCFLYCSLFPKDYVFFRNELIYLWMAQGYLHGENREMEIVGEEYFEKLVMCSFFQDFEKDNDDDKIIKCKMHDVVHDLAQSLTTNECFTINGDKELGKDCINAHHLSLRMGSQFPACIYKAKNLRTLLFLSPTQLYFSTIDPLLGLFQHLTCLRALTLKYSSFEKLPNEVEELIHLRLLNLSMNGNIEELAETMCNLCNLQTLDISYCYKLKKLPQGMGKLINLRHLIIVDCLDLTKPFPKGIERLSSLRTLNTFIIGGIEECKLGELKNLNHLSGSLTIKGLGKITDVQEAENPRPTDVQVAVNPWLKNKIHLRELGLWFDGEVEENKRVMNKEEVLNVLEPHPNLKSLMIYDYMGTTYPNWIMFLTKLKNIELLRWTKLEQLPPLGKLCFLESLTISGAQGVKKVGVEFLGIEESNYNYNKKKDEEGSTSSSSSSSLVLFPHLKSLQFSFLGEWEEWDGIGGTREREESGVTITIMPRLQKLEIRDCPKLKSLPDFIPTTLLNRLEIHRSPILSECCQRKGEEE